MHTVTLPSGQYDIPTPVAEYMKAVDDSLHILHGACEVYKWAVCLAVNEPCKANRLAAYEARCRLFELL